MTNETLTEKQRQCIKYKAYLRRKRRREQKKQEEERRLKNLEPIRSTLQLDDSENGEERKMSGGYSDDILDKIETKYPRIRSPRFYNDEYNFEVNSFNNTRNEDEIYLAKGSYSLIFSVNEINGNQNLIDKTGGNRLILKLFDQSSLENSELSDFINLWKSHKSEFYNNIIDIYMFGDIIDKDGRFVSFFILTRKYLTGKDDIKILSIDKKRELINSLSCFLYTMETRNIFYRDIKIDNIGFHEVDNKIEFVAIDYDINTFENTSKYTIGYIKELLRDNYTINTACMIASSFNIPLFLLDELDIIRNDKSNNRNNESVESFKYIHREAFAFLVFNIITGGTKYNDLIYRIFDHYAGYEYDSDSDYTQNSITDVFNNMHSEMLHSRKINNERTEDIYNLIQNNLKIDSSYEDLLCTRQTGGYYEKYIKYKNKYLKLKNSIK